MGAPVSVTVANLVMEDVETRALSTYEALPSFWKRDVDDMLMAFPRGQTQGFHTHLNSIKVSIQFVAREETGNTLPFLDTRITHYSDDSLTIFIFWKCTHTDKYLDFQSHHCLAHVHKVAVAHTLFHQAEKICTDFPERKMRRRIWHKHSTTVATPEA